MTERDHSIEQTTQEVRQKAKEAVAPAPVRRWRALVFQAYIIGAISTFAVLAFLARSTAYFTLDVAITREFQELRSMGLLAFMRIISWPGYSPQVLLIVVLAVLLLLYLKLRQEALFVAAAGAGSLFLNTLIKSVIARPRPASDLVEVFQQLSSYSFPSGHVMFYTAFFGFLAFLVYTHMKQSGLRLLLLGLFLMLVLLVGASRIYLGDHWASDVLGGYLLGSPLLLLIVWGYRHRQRALQGHTSPSGR